MSATVHHHEATRSSYTCLLLRRSTAKVHRLSIIQRLQRAGLHVVDQYSTILPAQLLEQLISSEQQHLQFAAQTSTSENDAFPTVSDLPVPGLQSVKSREAAYCLLLSLHHDSSLEAHHTSDPAGHAAELCNALLGTVSSAANNTKSSQPKASSQLHSVDDSIALAPDQLTCLRTLHGDSSFYSPSSAEIAQAQVRLLFPHHHIESRPALEFEPKFGLEIAQSKGMDSPKEAQAHPVGRMGHAPSPPGTWHPSLSKALNFSSAATSPSGEDIYPSSATPSKADGSIDSSTTEGDDSEEKHACPPSPNDGSVPAALKLDIQPEVRITTRSEPTTQNSSSPRDGQSFENSTLEPLEPLQPDGKTLAREGTNVDVNDIAYKGQNQSSLAATCEQSEGGEGIQTGEDVSNPNNILSDNGSNNDGAQLVSPFTTCAKLVVQASEATQATNSSSPVSQALSSPSARAQGRQGHKPTPRPPLSRAGKLRMEISIPPRSDSPRLCPSTSADRSTSNKQSTEEASKRQVPTPHSLTPPRISVRMNRAAHQRTRAGTHTAAVGFSSAIDEGEAGKESTPSREPKHVDYTSTPGHKRPSLVLKVAVLSRPPSVVPRETRASKARSLQEGLSHGVAPSHRSEHSRCLSAHTDDTEAKDQAESSAWHDLADTARKPVRERRPVDFSQVRIHGYAGCRRGGRVHICRPACSLCCHGNASEVTPFVHAAQCLVNTHVYAHADPPWL